MLTTKKLNLLGLITCSILISNLNFAIDVTKNDNVISFQSLEQSNYELRIVAPDKTRHTFQVADTNFNIFPSQLGSDLFMDGLYKYEFIANGTEQSFNQDVRTLNNQEITDEFINNFSAQGENISGVFTILGTDIVNADQYESTMNATEGGTVSRMQVIATDLIVQGSECVGFDCSASESFGSDTLRLKENNLRIHFDDTSASASFPGNDWRIIANDSTNGGANKFSIEDATAGRIPFTIEAGAPVNSLYVDDAGNIGVNTATPVVEVHVRDGDSPTLRLEQDGSSGFGAQTWDIAGNETNFFVRDVTNSSKLPFRIKPQAPTDTLFLAADGDIGLGTDSPDADLEISTSEAFTFFRLTATGASPNTSADITYTDGGSDGSLRFNIDDGDGQEMSLDHNGNMVIAGTLTTATTTYPDYVFEDGYNLMPLKDVESFIQKNGHLPNVPSADQMIENGINLTDMHVKLMEKVEELTLYTLAQESKINDMAKHITTQENQINDFQKQIDNLK